LIWQNIAVPHAHWQEGCFFLAIYFTFGMPLVFLMDKQNDSINSVRLRAYVQIHSQIVPSPYPVLALNCPTVLEEIISSVKLFQLLITLCAKKLDRTSNLE